HSPPPTPPYTLSLHDALPISLVGAALYAVVMRGLRDTSEATRIVVPVSVMLGFLALGTWLWEPTPRSPRLFLKFFGEGNRVSLLDRKSTRLNSSHVKISYAVF